MTLRTRQHPWAMLAILVAVLTLAAVTAQAMLQGTRPPTELAGRAVGTSSPACEAPDAICRVERAVRHRPWTGACDAGARRPVG